MLMWERISPSALRSVIKILTGVKDPVGKMQLGTIVRGTAQHLRPAQKQLQWMFHGLPPSAWDVLQRLFFVQFSILHWNWALLNRRVWISVSLMSCCSAWCTLLWDTPLAGWAYARSFLTMGLLPVGASWWSGWRLSGVRSSAPRLRCYKEKDGKSKHLEICFLFIVLPSCCKACWNQNPRKAEWKGFSYWYCWQWERPRCLLWAVTGGNRIRDRLSVCLWG